MVEYVNQLYQLIISTVCMAKKVIRIINILTCKYFKAPNAIYICGKPSSANFKVKVKVLFCQIPLSGKIY